MQVCLTTDKTKHNSMDNGRGKICLASASPRRQLLLQQVGIDYEVMVPDINETPLAGEMPAAFVTRVSREKAEQVYQLRQQRGMPELPTLGADTAVVLNNRILGKPEDRAHGMTMLADLSGQTHAVLTAVTIMYAGQANSLVQKSEVSFAPLSEIQIEAYWETGEAADKAGAYGIQGAAAAFISRIEGSYSGVMGLPLYETCQLLDQLLVQDQC